MYTEVNQRIILIVGAGFSGAVIARELAEANYSVTVLDKRDHIGGNAFDFQNEHEIRVHKYGPHIFHTNAIDVFNWLSKFTEWIPYKHKVKAQLNDGRYVTLPVNKETSAIVGKENVISTFIRPYSEKMWGIKLEDLDPNILNRVPIRDDLNEFYFPNDEFQVMPKNGYTEIFKNILDHPNINVKLNTSFSKSMEKDYDHIFCSMPIDEYYEYIFGPLPYRSIKFTDVHFPTSFVLPNSVVNFTHTGPETRVTEWKQLPNHGVNEQTTTLTYETPCDYTENNLERYYPVKDLSGYNRELYLKYKNIENPKVTFIGRLGMYAYLDMDQCVNSALQVAKRFLLN
jgi:UDP-galactopyranose mutase